MQRVYLILFLIVILLTETIAQSRITQTIKGKVVDITSKSPIIGATIIIEGSNPIIGTITEIDGSFRLTDIPVGRYNFKISSVGYEPQMVSDILVGSSKEVVLNIELNESVQALNEVTVRAITKDKPINSMATLSAKTFTVEETRRYAGGLDDPARMVSAFAGVTESSMRDNAIIIRGNSPKGVLYRLEGVRIPNPNHFSGGNVVGGGGVSMLSAQLLANSDFYTGAFPAEYGNALAGVFDMKLREGNSEKFEHTVQLGALGLDISSEGPIRKNSGASYLFNYRYSSLVLIAKMGVMPESEIPKYQDLSFKINLPTKKFGNFSLWGIGGSDQFDDLPENDSSKWETSYDRTENIWILNTGVLGLTHKLITSTKTYINTTIAFSGVKNQINTTMFDSNLVQRPILETNDNVGNALISTFINHKLSPKLSIKTGLNLNQLYYNLSISSIINNDYDTYNQYVNESGKSSYAEYFAQAKYTISPKLTANIGLNSHYFLLNNELAFDPRIGLRWDLTDKMALSAAYGIHTQTEELRIYMIQQNNNGTVSTPNKNLDLSKAQHFVMGFDWLLTENIKLKVEPYYQYLFDVPGIADSSYSMINFKQDWSLTDSLGNNSTGTNLGVDITLERFFQNNYYFLITGSLFDSRYKADDGITRNTRYDKGFAFNLLIGKEFTIKKTKLFGINSRITFTGGERTSPVNEELSKLQSRVVYDESNAFAEQYPSACFVDLTLTFRNNKQKYAGIWALQIKNVLGAKMYDGYSFNYKINDVTRNEYVVVLPILSYKVEF
jgi:hypothetical protein